VFAWIFPRRAANCFPARRRGRLELITLVVSVAGQKRLVFAVQACYGDALALERIHYLPSGGRSAAKCPHRAVVPRRLGAETGHSAVSESNRHERGALLARFSAWLREVEGSCA
jgi:hypothetical protein